MNPCQHVVVHAPRCSRERDNVAIAFPMTAVYCPIDVPTVSNPVEGRLVTMLDEVYLVARRSCLLWVL